MKMPQNMAIWYALAKDLKLCTFSQVNSSLYKLFFKITVVVETSQFKKTNSF